MQANQRFRSRIDPAAGEPIRLVAFRQRILSEKVQIFCTKDKGKHSAFGMTMETTESSDRLIKENANFVYTYIPYLDLADEPLRDKLPAGRLGGCLEAEQTKVGSLLGLVGFSQGEPLLAVSKVLEIIATSFEADAAVLWIPDRHRIALRRRAPLDSGNARR